MRALRHRLGWRQIDVAKAAQSSQNVVSLLERGHFSTLSVRRLRQIAAVLDASVVIELRWRGAAFDRLVDDAHTSLVAAVAQYLKQFGWLVEVEVSYSEFGERGSFDLLGFHPASRTLLAIEVKTDLPSGEATLRKLDEKARLADRVARKRFGWHPVTVGRLLVMPESPTLRRRIQRHDSLYSAALPARNVAVRRWLRQPNGSIPGCCSSQLEMPRVVFRARREESAFGGGNRRVSTLRLLLEKNAAFRTA